MTRTLTHELVRLGAPHDDDGRLIADRCAGGRASTSGTGRARCTCGELSPVLPNGAHRRGWHAEHLDYAATHAGRLDDLARIILRDYALPLVTVVRDESPDTARQHLADLDRRELEALAIVLAAMVPDDRSDRELLGWLHTRDADRLEAVPA